MADSFPQFSAHEPQSLAGKSVILTGGTKGIGRATANVLCSQGAKLLIFGRHEQELHETLQDLKKTPGEAHGLSADVTNEQDIDRIFREADQRFGTLDILINNAALASGPIDQGTFDDWRYLLETNLLGYFACTRRAVERMRTRSSGHIVNVGSMSADLRNAGSETYSATKAGIQAFTESLRKNVNKDGIRVSLVEPGAVATPLQGKPLEEQQSRVEAKEMLLADDIAWAIHYCLIQPPRCDVVMLQVRPLMQLI
jgi:NADP-dependent 3-hydroxy acid dehydrogenase YdfG